MITKTALENIVSKQRKMLANVSPGHPREIEESIPYLTDRMLLIGGRPRICSRTVLSCRNT